MSDIGRLIARFEYLIDEMERLVDSEPSLSDGGAVTFTPWRGDEADRAGKRKETSKRQFESLKVQAKVVSQESFRYLKSEGVDTSTSELEAMEQEIFPEPTPTQLIRYSRLLVATLKAKALLL